MLKLFTVKFEEKSESFNDAVLTNFLSDKKIIRWESNFFEQKGAPYWAVLLEYNLKYRLRKGKFSGLAN